MDVRKHHGLSLLEQLICLTSAATLLTLGVPTLNRMHHQHKLSSFASELAHSIQFARHHAFAHNIRTTLCPLDADNQCSRDWSGTLSIFEDEAGKRELRSEQDLMRILELPEGLELTWRGMGGGHALHFNAQGQTYVSNGTFLMKSIASGTSRRIVVNRQGRVLLKETEE
ncbi:GspH/FimT family pseudopilin [Pseudomonas sp. USHLN015]|uniref:GspH/FimT family pseudopilin n=1 Tax=Pseudomonas sp. USHLN015 TaxID=3081296 RepID=UPI00301E5C43